MEAIPCFFFVVFVIVVGIVVPTVIAQSKRANQAWVSAGRTLGLGYHAPRFLAPRRIEGSLPGAYVIVDTVRRGSGKNSKTYTRYRSRYHHSLGLGIRLSREGFFSGVGKLFGAQDIEVGDASFDADVIVKGHSPQRVIEFLTPARRVRIHRALMSYHGLTINDDEISWEKRGVVSNASEIVNTVRRLSQLAWFLSGKREEDKPLERAVAAQREGRLEEALEAVQEIPVLEAVEPLEARVLEGEMLYMAGRREEAARIFERAREEAPEDPEIGTWAEHSRRAVAERRPVEAPPPVDASPPEERSETPAPPAPGVADVEEVEPPPAAQPTALPPAAEEFKAPAGGVGLEAAAVCEEVFRSGHTSLDANRVFEERYQGQTVRWSGVLKRVESFSYDYVFGSEAGVKALLEIHDLTADAYGTKQVQAMVRLPPADEQALRERIGETVVFEGRLQQVDGLMRNVYVTDGHILPA